MNSLNTLTLYKESFKYNFIKPINNLLKLAKLINNISISNSGILIELKDNLIIESKNTILASKGYQVIVGKEIHFNPKVDYFELKESLAQGTTEKLLEDSKGL